MIFKKGTGFTRTHTTNLKMEQLPRNEYDNAVDVVAVRDANDAWSKAIELVMHAVKAYDSARANYRQTLDKIMPRRIQEQKIALQEYAEGQYDRMEQWQCAEREILDITSSLVPEIDQLNRMNWKFRY